MTKANITPGNWTADFSTVTAATYRDVRTVATLNGADKGRLVARVTGKSRDERAANTRAIAALPLLIAALTEILAGSDHTGIYRDEMGDECDEDEGTFEEFTDEEQGVWLETVADTARAALAAAGVIDRAEAS